MRRWPPYAISIATFFALAIGFVLVGNFVLGLAVARGVLPSMPETAEIEQALDVAFGSGAKKLAVTIGLNAIIVFVITMLATGLDLPRGQLARGMTRRLGLGPPQRMQIVVSCLGLLGLTTALDSIVQLLELRDVGALADIRRALDPLDGVQRVVFAALIGIGPGVTEELFFRGYLLNRVMVTQGTTVALVVSSVIFGFFHFDPVHTPLATVMGFYLGMCMFQTGSLWVPIIAHAANNAMATVTSGWTPSDVQAILLIPLGFVAGGAAITLLARGRPLLPPRAVVW